MKKKRVTRCAECSARAIEQQPGFTGAEVLHCTLRCATVDPDDGCTFGSQGEPMRWVPPEQVSLDGYAAVGGW